MTPPDATPRAIEDLRRWTSAEALGDVTVAADCASRIVPAESIDDTRPVDHKLPSPEEQLQAIALKFPAEVVAVDVSGRGFKRMSMRRRSMMPHHHHHHHQQQQQQNQQESHETVKRRSRPRRPRGKRRNTIAGTDQKEIRRAVGGETTAEEPEDAQPSTSGTSKRAHRSASTDLLGTDGKKDTSPVEKKSSHFDTLKAWGRSRLKLISPKSSQHVDASGSTGYLASGEQRSSRHSAALDEDTRGVEDAGVSRRARREAVKSNHERKPSSSSSSGKSVSSLAKQSLDNDQRKDHPEGGQQQQQIPASSLSVGTRQSSSVKLRESAAERRERRKGSGRADEPPHSSSGNWSASSESGRASIGSETTSTTHPPRSTTTASIGTSSTSLSHARRFKGRDNSASSSVTSEGTLTPDIIQDINAVPFSDDGETSSVYSCDTEGYYTSFHMDSGLKTLREEEPAQPQTPMTKSNEVHSDPTSPVAENEYELYGRGSTSTTTSSAGTVCTTLMAPPPPERKSSLTVVAMVHGQKQNGGESPDSGHNTSSSPVESASSPACTGRSCSEFEYSESSDLEGCERIERIRSKTAINTSRIPSMCVITPPGSDDENKDAGGSKEQKKGRDTCQGPGSVLMSATVGTSKMEVINGQDKNLYATVQTVMTSSANSSEKAAAAAGVTAVGQNAKISPLSGVLGKLRGVLPGRKHQQKPNQESEYSIPQLDSGDYVTIADVRNNNDKRQQPEYAVTTPTTVRPANVTYANADVFKRDAEYVSLSELPKKPDSSLERRRQGARVTLDSEGKVVYSSDSLKRRKGAHTTFNPGPFVKEGPSSPASSPLLHRAQITPRVVQRTIPDAVDGDVKKKPSPEPTSQPQQQLGKVIIRAAKSPDRSVSPDYVRTPATVVGPNPTPTPSATQQQRQSRQGAYVNVQGSDEEKALPMMQPTEPVSTSACPQKQPQRVQPPPYVGPPQVQKSHKDPYPYQVVYNNNPQFQQQHRISNNPQTQMRPGGGPPSSNNQQQQYHHQLHHHHHQQQQQHSMVHHVIDPYQQLILERNSLYHHHHHHHQQQQQQQPYSHYTENQKMYAHQLHHPIRQAYEKSQQHFYTLPNRRSHREVAVEPPRSITPDITRGLARAPLNAVHLLARQGQKSSSAEKLVSHYHGQAGHNCPIDQTCGKSAEQQRPVAPVDVKNRFASPVGLSALGYRLFASPIQDSPKHPPISPIGPEHSNGFKSSTPTSRAQPSVAERLALSAQRCASPNPALMHAGSDSGRSTPTNIMLSPIKSSMSNEELFAAIHKSKRRLNIRDEPESLSPAGSVASLSKGQQAIGTRHSWSPESQKTPEIPKSVLSPSATSRMDFKRLLLQQSIKSGPNRVSAAEQLKLSRQQSHDSQQQQQQQQSPSSQKSSQPLAKVLSPRSAWRFQTPRTDVLSSTIIEDTAAEEKAMKPSPETPAPATCFPPVTSTRRQLDMSGESARGSRNLEELRNAINKSQRSLEKSEKELENRLQAIDLDGSGTATKVQSDNSDAENPIKAIESRRMSNQLARAQFLASSGPTSSPNAHKDMFNRRFRARSESPQQSAQRSGDPGYRSFGSASTATITQIDPGPVTRSPSAPTLETAL
ncbi:uncharacterized protein LOC106638680 [Copidosoma floridanum]|uniref:uncharacterized protein LOC106638680 n=1 Tax=Copidosoma floridanum TaxID=29053 RepID=UPI000C6FA91E|nr:uncharacterized protein LOC106638680 [Copidosoma floridanum]